MWIVDVSGTQRTTMRSHSCKNRPNLVDLRHQNHPKPGNKNLKTNFKLSSTTSQIYFHFRGGWRQYFFVVFSRFRASDADALLDLDAQIDYQDASGKFPKLQGGFRHGWVQTGGFNCFQDVLDRFVSTLGYLG